MMVSFVLVGKERFMKKDKSGYWHKIYYLVEFNDNKLEQGAMGSYCKDCFIPESCYHTIRQEDIGREFVLEFGSNQYGNPEVIGLRFTE